MSEKTYWAVVTPDGELFTVDERLIVAETVAAACCEGLKHVPTRGHRVVRVRVVIEEE